MTGSQATMQRIKRIVVTVVGGTVLALGIALIVLPGPAFLVIPAGLAILAIEFAWARRWLRSARAILRQAGITNVTIVEHEELLGDHYDPRHKRLVLSSANYHGTSAAALGVAAHECGHAMQHKQAYAPLQLRMAAVGVTSFASQLVMWIPLLGMFTGLLAPKTGLLIMAVAWGIMMLFNLVTLPVEFDASRRAKFVLANMGFIQRGPESAAVTQVLNAAAWTYVAAFISSLIFFLWHLLPLLTGRQRN